MAGKVTYADGSTGDAFTILYKDVTSFKTLQTYDPVAGRIFHLDPENSLSQRVAAKYTELCVRLGVLAKGVPATADWASRHFNDHPEVRIQAICLSLKPLKDALLEEATPRHYKVVFSSERCCIEMRPSPESKEEEIDERTIIIEA